ncbi:MAG: radical SAM-associated putative lipoprotein [Tannerella sp.]|jgi:putative lipoprotein (rSAM/lipoprotein system)|nr:radical SAM-associated putative lipoprotein [Tannerella sp.]
MKKNYKLLVNSINWALAGVLTLLGFGSCSEDRVEYGTPSARYTVRGTVVDKATGKSVKGIRVGYTPGSAYVMYGTVPVVYGLTAATVSDANGDFNLSGDAFPVTGVPVPVYVDDIDGAANGLFKSDRLYIDFDKAEQTEKGKGWYNGEFTVTTNVYLAGQTADE